MFVLVGFATWFWIKSSPVALAAGDDPDAAHEAAALGATAADAALEVAAADAGGEDVGRRFGVAVAELPPPPKIRLRSKALDEAWPKISLLGECSNQTFVEAVQDQGQNHSV